MESANYTAPPTDPLEQKKLDLRVGLAELIEEYIAFLERDNAIAEDFEADIQILQGFSRWLKQRGK